MHVHIPKSQTQLRGMGWRQRCACGYSRLVDVNPLAPGHGPWEMRVSPNTHRLRRALELLRVLEWSARKPDGQWSCPACRVIKRDPPDHGKGCALAEILYGGYVEP